MLFSVCCDVLCLLCLLCGFRVARCALEGGVCFVCVFLIVFVCCLLFVVCCALFVACCLMFVGCCL